MECAELARVSAGGALAVDREKFSDAVTERIRNNEHITVIEEEVTEIPDGNVIIATGPLTSDGLADSIGELCGEYLYFHDAAAPIVTFDGFKVYEGCMPVEVLAKRGEDTLRFGPLKPVGLRDPRTDKRPWAVVQLRAENTAGSMYNLVGFQTNLKFGEQKRVFSLIPGLENAEFMRYGVMHRNTFINSPKLLNEQFNMRERPSLYFAGQMTGVEGYIESAASGIFAGLNMARQIQGLSPVSLPETTMLGALSKYISSPDTENFQPMGCNMGILPEWGERIKDKKLKYKLLAERGLADLDKCIAEL